MNKAHWIFETNETLAQLQKRFSPECVFVEITGLSPQPQEGWFYNGWRFIDPNNPPIEQARTDKLNELNQAAANAYVSGFASSASGASLWYDSDVDTQNAINRQYLIALNNPTAYSSMTFFSGIPAGVTPIRARPRKNDLDSAKTVQLLNAAQMVQLGNDLAAAWAGVKAVLWDLQAQVYAAATVDQVNEVAWPMD